MYTITHQSTLQYSELSYPKVAVDPACPTTNITHYPETIPLVPCIFEIRNSIISKFDADIRQYERVQQILYCIL